MHLSHTFKFEQFIQHFGLKRNLVLKKTTKSHNEEISRNKIGKNGISCFEHILMKSRELRLEISNENLTQKFII